MKSTRINSLVSTTVADGFSAFGELQNIKPAGSVSSKTQSFSYVPLRHWQFGIQFAGSMVEIVDLVCFILKSLDYVITLMIYKPNYRSGSSCLRSSS
jgi:hypothetical protein